VNGRRWPWAPTYERIGVENESLTREDVITCGYFYTLIKYIFIFLSVLNNLIGCEVVRIRVGTIRPLDIFGALGKIAETLESVFRRRLQ